MPATQRYQDAPSYASIVVAAESPDENLESRAAWHDGALPQVIAGPHYFDRAGGLLGLGETVPP